jgi:hypothetical protein
MITTSPNSAENLSALLTSKKTWDRQHFKEVKRLLLKTKQPISSVGMTEDNLRMLIIYFIVQDVDVVVKNATDVLNMASIISGGGMTKIRQTKFRRFKTKEIRYFLGLLEKLAPFNEEMYENAERWKVFFFFLRINDYTSDYPKVVAARDFIYQDTLGTAQ